MGQGRGRVVGHVFALVTSVILTADLLTIPYFTTRPRSLPAPRPNIARARRPSNSSRPRGPSEPSVRPYSTVPKSNCLTWDGVRVFFDFFFGCFRSGLVSGGFTRVVQLVMRFFTSFIVTRGVSTFHFGFRASKRFLMVSVLGANFSSFFDRYDSFLVTATRVRCPDVVVGGRERRPSEYCNFLGVLARVLGRLVMSFDYFFVLTDVEMDGPGLVSGYSFVSYVGRAFCALRIGT